MKFVPDVVCVDKEEAKIRSEAARSPSTSPILTVWSPSMCMKGGSTSRPISPGLFARPTQFYIAVGTPSWRGDGYADLSYVYAAVPPGWLASLGLGCEHPFVALRPMIPACMPIPCGPHDRVQIGTGRNPSEQ